MKVVAFKDNFLYLSVDGLNSYLYKIYAPLISIKFVHLFSDNSLLIADHTKCYYTSDWVTLNVSTVLDINGDPFIPTIADNFTTCHPQDVIQIIGDTEMIVWTNYSTHSATQYLNISCYYSTDKGHTIKTAYRFRNDPNDTENPNLFCRHGHGVFQAPDGYFYLLTGDSQTDGVGECHVLRGSYDLEGDSWLWELMGSGVYYKWTKIIWDGDFMYVAWDYTGNYGGLLKTPYPNFTNTENWDVLYRPDNDTCAVFKKNNEYIVIQTKWNGDGLPKHFYYSPDGINFHQIEATFSYINQDNGSFSDGVIREGKIYVSAFDTTQQVLFPCPMIEISQFIKSQGFPNAFN